jgi:hypothetical protein
MTPLPTEAPISTGRGVAAAAKLVDFAKQALSSVDPIAVLDEDGNPIGVVTRQAMMDAIYGEPEP